MWTISQIVEELILRSPFLTEALTENLANSAEVARKLKPEIEKRLLKKASLPSIAMALHRLRGRLRKMQPGTNIIKEINDITVRSNLVAFVCPNSADLPRVLEALSRSAAKRKDTFLNFSRGLHESLFIVSKEFEKEIAGALKKERGRLRRIEGLSAVTMKLSEKSLVMPGVYYLILKTIALEGISLVEVMSVRTEFSILFEDKNIDRAFSAIKRITSG